MINICINNDLCPEHLRSACSLAAKLTAGAVMVAGDARSEAKHTHTNTLPHLQHAQRGFFINNLPAICLSLFSHINYF